MRLEQASTAAFELLPLKGQLPVCFLHVGRVPSHPSLDGAGNCAQVVLQTLQLIPSNLLGALAEPLQGRTSQLAVHHTPVDENPRGREPPPTTAIFG